MPSFKPATSGDASATENGSAEPNVSAPPPSPDSASEAIEPAYAPLLPDLSQYDLTVGEAQALFQEEHRKLPSIRTLQRYCQEGRFDCYKLKTTRNGNPVHEWIINSTSLRRFIQTKPNDDTPAVMAAPEPRGDATDGGETQSNDQQSAIATTTPERADDASDELALPRSSQTNPNAMTTPDESGDATGGDMSRAELLIENARLTAQLDAQRELVDELRDDKQFMREEITQHRQNDRILADMHRETLQTLKAVAVAGRHTKIELPGNAPAGEGSDLFRDVPDSEQGGQRFADDGV